jgi:hypothetical protein
VQQGIRTSDPRIAAWYKNGYSENACRIPVPRMYLILLIFWCRKEDSKNPKSNLDDMRASHGERAGFNNPEWDQKFIDMLPG